LYLLTGAGVAVGSAGTGVAAGAGVAVGGAVVAVGSTAGAAVGAGGGVGAGVHAAATTPAVVKTDTRRNSRRVIVLCFFMILDLLLRNLSDSSTVG